VNWEYRVLYGQLQSMLGISYSSGVYPAPNWLPDRLNEYAARVRSQAELEWREEKERSQLRPGESHSFRDY